MTLVLDLLVFTVSASHVLLAPFTKVEESFILHATHDVLFHGAALSNYDHRVFPGPIPRTFIGSLILAHLVRTVHFFVVCLGFQLSKPELQTISRLTLAGINSFAICLLRRAVGHRFGRPTALFFVVLTCTQFHLPFWMGRTVPNMFALFPVNVAMYLLIGGHPHQKKISSRNISAAISLLTFAAVVFRAEILLLLVLVCLQLLATHQISLLSLIKTGLLAGSLSIACTIIIDSYFWNTFPLWPELAAFHFNVVKGKSSDWGISPPLTYFTNYLPKLLLGALPLSIMGAIVDARIRSLLVPMIAFIGMMSYLGHKEWRFIIYTVPIFNIAAARGARWMFSQRKGTWKGRLCIIIAFSLFLTNAALTVISTRVSMMNYPGGHALSALHMLVPAAANNTPIVHVHISNLAAQTGASLFQHINSSPHAAHADLAVPSWTYNKTERLSSTDMSSSSIFTHRIAEAWEGENMDVGMWRIVYVVPGFERLELDLGGLKEALWVGCIHEYLKTVRDVLKIKERSQLVILERIYGQN